MSCNNQATGSWDCTVRLWPLTDGKMNNTCLKGHRSNIHAVAFSSNSLLVSTCTVFFLLVTKCKSNYAILLYMYGQLHERARCTKSATAIGYPSRQDGAILSRSGLPTMSCEKIFPESQIINPLVTKLFRSRLTPCLVNNPCIQRNHRPIIQVKY